MRSLFCLLSVSSVLLFSACAGRPVELLHGNLATLEEVQVQYEGALRTDGLGLPSEEDASVPKADKDTEDPPRQIQVSAEIVQLARETFEELLPDASSVGAEAGFVREELLLRALRELKARGLVQVISSPRLIVNDGQRASIRMQNERSFLKSFRIEKAKEAMIADPQVAVLRQGISMLCRPDWPKGQRGVALALELRVVDLLGKPRVVTVRPFGRLHDASLQVPVYFDQKLSSNSFVRPGRALFLTGLQDATDEMDMVTVVFVRVRGLRRTKRV